jgi:hypothetical protein
MSSRDFWDSSSDDDDASSGRPAESTEGSQGHQGAQDRDNSVHSNLTINGLTPVGLPGRTFSNITITGRGNAPVHLGNTYGGSRDRHTTFGSRFNRPTHRHRPYGPGPDRRSGNMQEGSATSRSSPSHTGTVVSRSRNEPDVNNDSDSDDFLSDVFSNRPGMVMTGLTVHGGGHTVEVSGHGNTFRIRNAEDERGSSRAGVESGVRSATGSDQRLEVQGGLSGPQSLPGIWYHQPSRTYLDLHGDLHVVPLELGAGHQEAADNDNEETGDLEFPGAGSRT